MAALTKALEIDPIQSQVRPLFTVYDVVDMDRWHVSALLLTVVAKRFFSQYQQTKLRPGAGVVEVLVLLPCPRVLIGPANGGFRDGAEGGHSSGHGQEIPFNRITAISPSLRLAPSASTAA